MYTVAKKPGPQNDSVGNHSTPSVYKPTAHRHSHMSDTEEPVLSELNQILKLQEAIKTEYHGIVDGYSQGDGVLAENQAVLNNLVVRFMDLSLKATGLLAVQGARPDVAYGPDPNPATTIDIDAVETVEVIARSLSAVNVDDTNA